ncbi:MAG: hypothetical protein AAB932_04460 [Patescibacteria group bacterium]
MVTKDGDAKAYTAPVDTEPPDAFIPEFVHDPLLLDGQWVVVFEAKDKTSGIQRYDVYESRRRYTEEALAEESVPWVPAESPHVLSDQTRRSFVYLRAIDTAGNVRIAMLSPQYPLAWYENAVAWSIVSVIIIITFGIVFAWRRRTHTSR